jgi:putative ABC transport system permease protein
MKELFGIPMDTIMYVLVAIFAVSVASVAYIWLTNRTMFRMGLRNLPRRGLQTGLVVVGLMLATLITTASFTTGDTIDYSITKLTYDKLQRVDLALDFNGDAGASTGEPAYVREDGVAALEQQFAGDGDFDTFLPALLEPVAALNTRTNLSEPEVTLAGIDPQRFGNAGGLRLVSGGKADLEALGPNDILLNESAAEDLDARVGDVLTVYVDDVTTEIRVAGIVESELASGDFGGFDAGKANGGAMLLSSVQRLSGHEGEINFVGVALTGGVRGSLERSEGAASRLEPFVQSAEGREALGIGGRAVEVEEIKRDSVDEAQSLGNMFTTFFLVLGLFSIAAGIMLIFMIFVMLAAERKAEMGMTRAVGAQRTNLVQSFVSEGMAYNLIAGAVGAALGVAAALGLVIGFLRITVGDDFEFLTAHVTWRSLVISYCLGVVVTFITVVIASVKVSSVNIVAAIRGTEEDGRRAARRKTNWKWVAIGVPAMVIPPLGIWLFLRKGFGVAWTWILAPAGILLSLLMILASKGAESEILFSIGFSVLPLCVAAIASHYKAPARATWTLVGAYLAAYWLSPVPIGEKLLGSELKGDIEMFPVAGVMTVIAFTLIIVFNARLLTGLFQRNATAKYRTAIIAAGAAVASIVAGIVIGDRGDGVGQVLYLVSALFGIAAAVAFAAARFSHIAPAMKMGVAYPLSNRFRTGMTIAMFSLIIFSLVTFSAVNANFQSISTGKDGDGGWDVLATANRNNPIDALPQALVDAGSPDAAEQITNIGRVTLFTGREQVRQPNADDNDWNAYPVVAGDAAFFAATNAKLDARAEGYDSDREVFDAASTGTRFAIIDSADFNNYGWMPEVTVEDDTFEPFELQFRDTVSGETRTVTVIGTLATKLPGDFISGVYVNEALYTGVYGEPDYQRTYAQLADGVNPKAAARTIESALVTQGVQAESIKQIIDDDNAQQRAFTRMFQGFMALGLFVGMAALGVIAFRSVVERRQQIGMLRAIGYQTGTVSLTFMLESGFIAMMGILSGVVGGVIVSRNLFTTGQFSGEGVEFMIPWTEVIGFVVIAFIVSLFMTWWPSRGAAKVPVADALRYE